MTSSTVRRPSLERPRRSSAVLAAFLAAGLLASCAAGPGAAGPTGASSSTTDLAEPRATERAASAPRLAVTYDGGVLVLDALSLETVADLPVEGYLRVNAAGDGRHVLVSTTGGFRVLDAATWGQAHGDHTHWYTADPLLTDVTYPADEPGHVVVHAGRTALFDDATGHVVVVDSAHVAEGPDGEHADAREHTTPDPHHGVAVELEDGSLVVSDGTSDERTGVRVLDADGDVLAATDECPGVHGETVSAGGAVTIGCEDGVVLVRDGALTKVDGPGEYARIGNQAGSEHSPVALGDLKTDPEAELERPTRVSLVDTRTGELRTVTLPASYTFRSLARGDEGEALVLGTDGALHVIDPETGRLERSVPLIDPWTEPDDWQTPRPSLRVHDGSAYVTDPATRRVLAVDVATGAVFRTATLDVVPDEMAVATGEATEAHGH